MQGEDPHGWWTPTEVRALQDFVDEVSLQRAPVPQLEVIFQPDDKIVPVVLAEYLDEMFSLGPRKKRQSLAVRVDDLLPGS